MSLSPPPTNLDIKNLIDNLRATLIVLEELNKNKRYDDKATTQPEEHRPPTENEKVMFEGMAGGGRKPSARKKTSTQSKNRKTKITNTQAQNKPSTKRTGKKNVRPPSPKISLPW